MNPNEHSAVSSCLIPSPVCFSKARGKFNSSLSFLPSTLAYLHFSSLPIGEFEAKFGTGWYLGAEERHTGRSPRLPGQQLQSGGDWIQGSRRYLQENNSFISNIARHSDGRPYMTKVAIPFFIEAFSVHFTTYTTAEHYSSHCNIIGLLGLCSRSLDLGERHTSYFPRRFALLGMAAPLGVPAPLPLLARPGSHCVEPAVHKAQEHEDDLQSTGQNHPRPSH